ncbi:TPA: hypothetical protein ACQ30S_002632 [Yersinia enterocolitica]
MLLTLCDKAEAAEAPTQGKAPKILAAFNQLENILQWMSEQKLDLPTLQAMLTDKYSATACSDVMDAPF